MDVPFRRAAPGAVLGPDEYRLSVIVPVYNEVETLEAAVERLRAVEQLPLEIIVVDDASTDGSRDLLREMLADGRIHRLVLQDPNRGKGAAVRAGFDAARGDIAVIQDADLEYDPRDLPNLLEPILDGRADAVIGTRFRGEGAQRVLYYWHSLGNRLLTMLSNVTTNLNLTDMECCYKAIRTDLLRRLPLTARRFGIEPELVARLAQAGARVYEVPVRYDGRTYAEGKKITWRDGLAAFWHIYRAAFRPPRARYVHLPPLAPSARERAEGRRARRELEREARELSAPAARGEPVADDRPIRMDADVGVETG